jgi:hypothetical protein
MPLKLIPPLLNQQQRCVHLSQKVFLADPRSFELGDPFLFFPITTRDITLFRDKNATVQRQPFITEFLAAAVINKNSAFMANFRSFSVMF